MQASPTPACAGPVRDHFLPGTQARAAGPAYLQGSCDVNVKIHVGVIVLHLRLITSRLSSLPLFFHNPAPLCATSKINSRSMRDVLVT